MYLYIFRWCYKHVIIELNWGEARNCTENNRRQQRNQNENGTTCMNYSLVIQCNTYYGAFIFIFWSLHEIGCVHACRRCWFLFPIFCYYLSYASWNWNSGNNSMVRLTRTRYTLGNPLVSSWCEHCSIHRVTYDGVKYNLGYDIPWKTF